MIRGASLPAGMTTSLRSSVLSNSAGIFPVFFTMILNLVLAGTSIRDGVMTPSFISILKTGSSPARPGKDTPRQNRARMPKRDPLHQYAPFLPVPA